MCLRMKSPATSRVGKWRPARARRAHAGKPTVEKVPINLARQPHQRMAKVALS
jgi:hypothetical protein